MSTFVIFVSNDEGKSFEFCNACGYFKNQNDADLAKSLIEKLIPGMYEVRQAKRGRRPGQKDVRPRKPYRRSNTELREEIVAKVLNAEVIETKLDDNGDYIPLTQAQLDEMNHEVYADVHAAVAADNGGSLPIADDTIPPSQSV